MSYSTFSELVTLLPLLFCSTLLWGTIDVSVHPLSDPALCDGGLEIEAVGNAGDFTVYVSSDNGFSEEVEGVNGTILIENLCGGDYVIEVENRFKVCRQRFERTITDCTFYTAAKINGISCPNEPGFINLTVDDGIEPYTYEWNNGATTQDLDNLPPGIYTVTITDTGGCMATESFEIKGNIDILLSDIKYAENNLSPSGSYINIRVESESPPFTFQWSNGATTKDISNIPSGTYTVTVTDDVGCTGTLSVEISDSDHCFSSGFNEDSETNFGQNYEEIEVTSTVTLNSFSGSDDGAIDLTLISGGDVYYFWEGEGTFTASTQDISELVAGTYCVTVDNGCAEYNSCFELRDCNNLSGNFLRPVIQNTCPDNEGGSYNEGSITLLPPEGNGPYTFNWSNGATGNQLTNLQTGEILVTVTFGNDCQVETSFTIDSAVETVSRDFEGNNKDVCVRKIFCNSQLVEEEIVDSRPGEIDYNNFFGNCKADLFCGDTRVGSIRESYEKYRAIEAGEEEWSSFASNPCFKVFVCPIDRSIARIDNTEGILDAEPFGDGICLLRCETEFGFPLVAGRYNCENILPIGDDDVPTSDPFPPIALVSGEPTEIDIQNIDKDIYLSKIGTKKAISYLSQLNIDYRVTWTDVYHHANIPEEDSTIFDHYYIGMTGISSTIDDNAISIGFFSQTIQDIDSTISVSSQDKADIFITKYDKEGNRIWLRTAGGQGFDYPTDVTIDENKNSIITGYFESNLSADAENLSATQKDGFLFKYDVDGNVIWSQQITGNDNQEGLSVTTDSNQNIFVSGACSGNSQIGGLTIPVNTNRYSYFISKLTPQGQPLWVKGGHSPEFDLRQNHIIADKQNSVIASGDFLNSFTFDNGTNLTTQYGSRAIFIVKYTSNGTIQWAKIAAESKNIASSDSINVSSIDINKDNSFLISGHFTGTARFGKEIELTSRGGSDIFIARFDTNGKLIWVKQQGLENDEFCYSITTDGEGTVAYTGEFADTTVLEGRPFSGSTEYLSGYVIGFTDSSCVENIALHDNAIPSQVYHAAQTLTTTSQVNPSSTVVLKAGERIYFKPGFHAKEGSYVHGYIEDCEDNLQFTEDTPPVTARQADEPKIVPELNSQTTLRCYPNPLRHSTTIEYHLPEAAPVMVSVHDMTGKQVVQLTNTAWQEAGIYTLEYNASASPGGIYYVLLQTKGQVLSQKLIVLQ